MLKVSQCFLCLQRSEVFSGFDKIAAHNEILETRLCTNKILRTQHKEYTWTPYGVHMESVSNYFAG